MNKSHYKIIKETNLLKELKTQVNQIVAESDYKARFIKTFETENCCTYKFCFYARSQEAEELAWLLVALNNRFSDVWTDTYMSDDDGRVLKWFYEVSQNKRHSVTVEQKEISATKN